MTWLYDTKMPSLIRFIRMYCWNPLLLPQLLSGATILGAIFCFSAFCVRSLYFFVVLFSMGELLVFATQVILNSTIWVESWWFHCMLCLLINITYFYNLILPFWILLLLSMKSAWLIDIFFGLLITFPWQAPVNYVSLRCVKPSLRPLSMAVSTVSIHIFGDVPSSPLAGILQVCLKSSLLYHILRKWRLLLIFSWYDNFYYTVGIWKSSFQTLYWQQENDIDYQYNKEVTVGVSNKIAHMT